MCRKGIVGETIEDDFTVGYVEQNEGVKTTIRNMVEEALIKNVKQGRLDTVLLRHVGRLSRYARFMTALT